MNHDVILKHSPIVFSRLRSQPDAEQQSASLVKLSARGFTLIELLIVITIVALLAAIVSSVAIKVKLKSESATCVSNLRQMTAAAMLYSSENGDIMPMPTESGGLLAWPNSLAPYLSLEEPFPVEMSVKTCPSQYKIVNQSRTYGINRQLDAKRQGRGSEGPVTMSVMSRQGVVDGVDYPTRLTTTPYFMCGKKAGTGRWRVWRSKGDSANNENDFPHQGVCNMSFLDGHVEPTRAGEGIWGDVTPGFQDGNPAF